jgi:ATP-binding cassette, subfamily B, bacterial
VLSKLDRVLLSKYLKPQWPRAVLLGVLLIAGIGSQLGNPYIAKTFIDQAQAGKPFEELVRIGVLFLGVALITQISTVAETYVAEDLGWRTTNVLRADLTRHVLSLDGSFHSEHGAGELIERVDGDVSAIANFFSRFIVHVLGNALFLVGMLVLLLVEDVRVGSVLAVFVLGAFMYGTKGGGFVGHRARETRRAAAALSSFLEERLGGLPDLKTSGADAYAMRRLHERLGERYRRTASSVMAASLFNGTIGLFLPRRRRRGPGGERGAPHARRDDARQRLSRLPVHDDDAAASRPAAAADEQLPAGHRRDRPRA